MAAALPWIGAASGVYSAVKGGSSGGGSSGSSSGGIPSDEEFRRLIRFAQESQNASVPLARDTRQQTLNQNKEFQPQETQRMLDNLRQTMYGLNDLSGEQLYVQGNQSNALNTLLRQGENRDVTNMGPVLKDALVKNNQSLYTQMDMQQTDSPMMQGLKQRSTADLNMVGAIDSMFAADNARLRGFQDTAAADVARQGRLSDEQLRDVQQYSRQGDEARGMLRSGQSIGNEILNTERARKENQLFADQRLGNIQNLLGQSEGRQLGIRNSFIANAGNVDQQAFGQGQQRIQNRINTLFDPSKAILGRTGLVNENTIGNAATLNLNNERQPGMNDLNSIWTSLTQMGSGMAQQNANNSAGMGAGISGAIGGLMNSGIDWSSIFGGGGNNSGYAGSPSGAPFATPGINPGNYNPWALPGGGM